MEKLTKKTVELTVTVNEKENYYIYVSNPFPQWWVDEVAEFIEREKIQGKWVITNFKTL